MMLKRTTPQNIVIGGAAGALPPVIGWAAVTGDVGLPALDPVRAGLLLDAAALLGALAADPQGLRRGRRADAAGGAGRARDDAARSALYTILLVAISLVLFAVARMGAIYLVAAVVLGARLPVPGLQAVARRRVAGGSTAGAIRLYKYSITYLSLLFLAVAVDALVVIPVG